MKVIRCTTCGRFLGEDQMRRIDKSGVDGYCKICQRRTSQYWAENNPENMRLSFCKWATNNIEKKRASARRWARDNPKQDNENGRKYYYQNLEKSRGYTRKWRKENPGKIAALHATHLARKRDQHDPTTDPDKVEKIYKLSGILNRDLKQTFEVDHIQPVSKGGSSHETNLQVITRDQNRSKRDDPNNKVKGITINDIELLHPDIFNVILNGTAQDD